MLRHNLARTTAGVVPRPTHSVSPTSCVLLVGLCVVVFAFLPGAPYRLDQYDLPKDVALGALGAASAFCLLSSHNIVREDRLAFTLAAFLGWGILTAPFVGENHVLAWRTVGLFASAASVFLLARRVGTRGNSGEVFTGITLIIGLMCALVLLEAYGGIPFFSASGRRPGATLGNRNLVARLACMALPLLWTRLVANKNRVTRYAVLAVVSEAVAVIMLSRSRGALLVACGLAVLLPAVTRWRAPAGISSRWPSAATVWVAGFLFSSAAVAVLPNRLGWAASDFASSARRVTEYQRGTGRGRLIQAATTWQMIRHNPVWGVGPGNWSVVYPAYAQDDDPSVIRGAFYPGPQTPRSDVLPLLAEWGVLGFGLGIVFLGVFGTRAARLVANTRVRVRLNGGVVFGVSLAAMLLGLFDSILRVAPTVVLLAMLVGLALGEGEREAAPQRADDSRWPRRVWRAILAVYVVLSVAFARSAAQDLDALRIINTLRSGTDLVRAVEVAPNNVEARAMLSYVLVSAGRCDLAMPHLNRAAYLQPFSLFFTRLREQCSHVPTLAPR